MVPFDGSVSFTINRRIIRSRKINNEVKFRFIRVYKAGIWRFEKFRGRNNHKKKNINKKEGFGSIILSLLDKILVYKKTIIIPPKKMRNTA